MSSIHFINAQRMTILKGGINAIVDVNGNLSFSLKYRQNDIHIDADINIKLLDVLCLASSSDGFFLIVCCESMSYVIDTTRIYMAIRESKSNTSKVELGVIPVILYQKVKAAAFSPVDSSVIVFLCSSSIQACRLVKGVISFIQNYSVDASLLSSLSPRANPSEISSLFFSRAENDTLLSLYLLTSDLRVLRLFPFVFNGMLITERAWTHINKQLKDESESVSQSFRRQWRQHVPSLLSSADSVKYSCEGSDYSANCYKCSECVYGVKERERGNWSCVSELVSNESLTLYLIYSSTHLRIVLHDITSDDWLVLKQMAYIYTSSSLIYRPAFMDIQITLPQQTVCVDLKPLLINDDSWRGERIVREREDEVRKLTEQAYARYIEQADQKENCREIEDKEFVYLNLAVISLEQSTQSMKKERSMIEEYEAVEQVDMNMYLESF